MDLHTLAGLTLPIIAVVVVFTFVAVANWSENRRKERETYYRHETYHKMLESPGASAETVLELMHQEELQRARQRIEGLRLGGAITTAVGIGLIVFLYFQIPQQPVYLVGLMPLLIGLVLTVHGFLAAPSRAENRSVSRQRQD